MTIEQMKMLRIERGLTYHEIAVESGLSTGTIQRIFSREGGRPHQSTLLALDRAITALSAGKRPGQDQKRPALTPGTGRRVSAVREAAQRYYLRSEHTPDETTREERGPLCEVIDGVHYAPLEPSLLHQEMVFSIARALHDHLREHGGECKVLLGPLPWSSEEMEDLFYPDLMVVCDPEKLTMEGCIGAPDLCIEVLSEGSYRKDSALKLNRYLALGVREYWLVDPVKQKVIVYRALSGSIYPQIYGFTDRVSVGIWGGACKVDFAKIHEETAWVRELDHNSEP